MLTITQIFVKFYIKVQFGFGIMVTQPYMARSINLVLT